MKEINIRRSVRTYQSTLISDEIIEKLLRAGMQSPSAKNQQPWYFIVVNKRELLDQLSNMTHARMLKEAPLAIICIYDNRNLKSPDFVFHDMGALTQTILLEATHLNLGAVWIGVAPREERIGHIKSIFKIEDYMIPFSIISIGYPKENDAGNYYLDRFDPSRIRYNK